jgi:UDP-glucuronate decarboxylase
MTYRPPNYEIISTDIDEVLGHDMAWDTLSGKTIAVLGATSMVAGYIVDALMMLKQLRGIELAGVIVAVRNTAKAEARFARYLKNDMFSIVQVDVSRDIDAVLFTGVNIMIHAASIARPDRQHPVDVMAPNILGTWNLLNIARELPDFEQFIYFSSGIVNGENIKSKAPVSEEMYFPTSCLSPTSCYTESKRAGESIAKAFMDQYGVPVKMIRHFGTYGPGMDLNNDPRAFTSFVKSVVNGEDIVLHSTGEETRFWCYISDATEVFFRVLFASEFGGAWNIANDEAGSTIYEFADAVTRQDTKGVAKVTFNPGSVPEGYTPFKSDEITVPDVSKVRALGFAPKVGIDEGLKRTVGSYVE